MIAQRNSAVPREGANPKSIKQLSDLFGLAIN
jgi:hypothetical protein